MKNINQKFYYYSLSKGVTLNLDNKVKFINSNNNSKIYQIEDNKNIFTVTDYFKDDFLGGLSCDCDLYSISGFCPHTVAILNYKGDIKTTVSKNTLDESFLDSENKLNNSNNFDEDNDNNKGENFDKIFDGLDTLELLEFFKEVLFDNLDIYKQFIKRFRGFDIDVLYDEFIELNTDYLNEDSFIEELSKFMFQTPQERECVRRHTVVHNDDNGKKDYYLMFSIKDPDDDDSFYCFYNHKAKEFKMPIEPLSFMLDNNMVPLKDSTLHERFSSSSSISLSCSEFSNSNGNNISKK